MRVCIVLLMATLSNLFGAFSVFPQNEVAATTKTTKKLKCVQFVCLIAVGKILKCTVISMRACKSKIIILTSCTIQFALKMQAPSSCAAKQNQKYGRHLSIRIQNTLNELINWSSLLMVSK